MKKRGWRFRKLLAGIMAASLLAGNGPVVNAEAAEIVSADSVTEWQEEFTGETVYTVSAGDVTGDVLDEIQEIGDQAAASITDASDTYDGSDAARPKSIEVNTEITGKVAKNESSYYSFTLEKAGFIELYFGNEKTGWSGSGWKIYLNDSNDFDTDVFAKVSFDLSMHENELVTQLGVKAGTYYIRVDGSGVTGDITYNFRVKYTESEYYEKEHESVSDPNVIEPGQLYTATIYAKKDIDYYKFEIPGDGLVQIDFGNVSSGWSGTGWKFHLYTDSDFTSEILTESIPFGNKEDIRLALLGMKKGTYYVKVEGLFDICVSYPYHFKISHVPSADWEYEPDSSQNPRMIQTDHKYSGAGIPNKDDIDYYTFTLTQKKKVKLNFNHVADGWSGTGYEFYLYNREGFSSSEIKKISIVGDSGEDVNEELGELDAGTYYVKIKGRTMNALKTYSFTLSTGAKSTSTEASGTATMDGAQFGSLAEAFTAMKDASKDYTITLATDMTNEKKLAIPAKAKSVTINGDGHTVTLKTTAITSKVPLTITNATIVAQNKKGAAAKLTVNASADLKLDNVTFSSLGTTIKGKKKATLTLADVPEVMTISGFGTVNVDGVIKVNKQLNTQTLNLAGSIDGADKVNITVGTELKGTKNAKITLNGTIKPITLKGTASGKVSLGYRGADGKDATLKDGTQLLKLTKKVSDDSLKVFDVDDLGEQSSVSYALARPAATKAALYGKTIRYKGTDYALWKDVLAKITENSDTVISVTLTGNTCTGGAWKLPKAGKYESITVDGGGNVLSFTGNVKLTGNMTLTNVTLHGQTAKGADKAYKLTKGKFELTQGTGFNAGNITIK